MEVINFFSSDRQEYWLAEIGKSDCSAGHFLYKLLKNGELQDYVGAFDSPRKTANLSFAESRRREEAAGDLSS